MPANRVDKPLDQIPHTASSRSFGSSQATIVIKEANWKSSEQAFVPVDGKVFQILRNKERFIGLFETAGFYVMKIYYGKKMPGSIFEPEIVYILSPLRDGHSNERKY